MSLFARILVGVDGSRASRDTVVLAAQLAREHNGHLVLCHAVNWLPAVAETQSTGAIVDPVPTIDFLRHRGEALLAEAAEAAQRIGVDSERRMIEGEPAEGIVRVAAELRCRLIVMGTHGRAGLSYVWLGSTTEAVLRLAAIPVLTIRSADHPTVPERDSFERILVGIDNSEPSHAAVAAVLQLPSDARRRILFCSVAGPNDLLHQQAQQIVDDALASARAHDVWAEGLVVDGSPRDALLATAEQRHAGLIVLGSHGRRGMRRLFLGSVAEGIVRTAPVPVLVVRTAAA